MKRTLTVVGAAVIALASAVAASQAQGRQNPQAAGEPRGGRPEIGQGVGPGGDRFECGPPRRDGQPGPQGAMRGRGPGGGRQGGFGRPGGPGGMVGRGNPLCGLDLTDEQEAQIKAIHQKSHDEVLAVLTPEQREKLAARRGGR